MSDQRENKKFIILPENVQIDYTFEKLLKTFLKKSQEIIREVKEKRYYIKPSDVKRKHKKEIDRKYHIKIKWRNK